jgi:FKBP-type peptidyl-prolyl cis-trans isomerase 2
LPDAKPLFLILLQQDYKMMSVKKILLLLVSVSVLSGCLGGGTSLKDWTDGEDGKMNVIVKGDIVKVEYVGRYPDGEVFDKSEGRGPLEFTVGNGQMIKGFDDAVLGMALDEEKTVTIPPEDAYGTEDSGQRVSVPLEQIQGGGDINVGSVLYSATGMQGTIEEIKDGVATIMFRHPMAGKTLEFWIKVTEIKKAGNAAEPAV